MRPINVGLLGIGTVGGGTWDVLKRNADEIQRRAGRAIRISQVADKAVGKARKCVGKKAKVLSDAFRVVRDAQIDIIVELIGGTTIAKELVLKAIRNGKHVVTANKALLATHGTEIFAAAQKNGVMVAFEGSVGGGIPIIKALREGLAANRIEWIAGIINGTSNFILSEMRDKGLDFSAALGEAQRRGYAEADPSFDIEGIAAAHNLTIRSTHRRSAPRPPTSPPSRDSSPPPPSTACRISPSGRTSLPIRRSCRSARSRPPVTCACACSTSPACSPTSPASSPPRRSRSMPWCRRSPARARAASTSSCSPTARWRRTSTRRWRRSRSSPPWLEK